MGYDRVSPFWKRMVQMRESDAHKAYHGHVFGCPSCNPQVARYCQQGFELWAAYQVPMRAESIMRESDIRRRRDMLETSPDRLRDLVAAEVKRLWDDAQEERRAAR